MFSAERPDWTQTDVAQIMPASTEVNNVFPSLADVALCNVYITLPADGVYRAVAVGGVKTCVPLRS